MDEQIVRSTLTELMNIQKFAILATNNNGLSPHASIVCFASADNLESIIFVTPAKTRKFDNLKKNNHAVLFIDTRENDKIREIYGIEAKGTVKVLSQNERLNYEAVYLRKFSELKTFVKAADSVMCILDVDSYDIVHRFQEVIQLRIKAAGEQKHD